MIFRDAVTTGFKGAFHFSGRAKRAAFWKFVLFMCLGFIATVVLNSLLFGPELSYIMVVDALGQPNAGTTRVSRSLYNGGMFGDIFFAICLLPWLAVSWRRMHDIGEPGYLPFLTVLTWSLCITTLIMFMAGPSNTLNAIAAGQQINIPLSSYPGLIIVVSFVLVILINMSWLCRPSQPETNKFGPNLTEVPS